MNLWKCANDIRIPKSYNSSQTHMTFYQTDQREKREKREGDRGVPECFGKGRGARLTNFVVAEIKRRQG